MTYDEVFIKSLKDFRKNCAQELAENKRTDGLNLECVEYYEIVEKYLSSIMPRLKGIDSLYELDENGEPIFTEEEFSFVISALEDYSEAFIVDGRDPKKLKDDEKFQSMLADIIFDFYDEDEDFEDFEDFEEEEKE